MKMKRISLSATVILGFTVVLSCGDKTHDRILNAMDDEIIKGAFVDVTNPHISPGVILDSTYRKFYSGMVIEEGYYYKEEGGIYKLRPLPPIGSKGVVYFYSSLHIPELSHCPTFYYVEGDDGWSGWVRSTYFGTRGGYCAEVNASGVIVHSAPNPEAEIVAELSFGEEVVAYTRSSEKETIDGICDYWCAVCEEQDKWVFGGFLTPLFTYNSIHLLTRSDPWNIFSSDAVKIIVDEILASPDRLTEEYLPDEHYELGEYKEPTYQVQAVLYGCRNLLSRFTTDAFSEQDNNLFWEWCEKLYTEYKDHLVNNFYYEKIMIAGAQGLLLQMKAYEILNQRENYEKTLLEANKEYGKGYPDTSASITSYGYTLIKEASYNAREKWGDDFAVSLLDKLYEKAPTRLLTAKALLEKGKLLRPQENGDDEALAIFMEVIDKYPYSDIKYHHGLTNFAHYAVDEVMRIIRDNTEQREFLTSLTSENTPFPVRLYAAYLLSSNNENYRHDQYPREEFDQLYEDLLAIEHEEYVFE